MQIPNFNPLTIAVKKYVQQILTNKYTTEVDETIERITHNMVTKRDTENLTKLIISIFQAGYSKAITAAQESLEKQGLKLKLMPPKDTE